MKSQTLVGIEYLVELVRTPEVNVLHVCMLCGFNGKEREVLKHFKEIEHQKKFLVSCSSGKRAKIENFLF
jgi:hypothetical protein